MSIDYEPRLPAAGGGCLNCGPRPARLPAATVLGVGFGIVTVTRNGVVVWSGDSEVLRLRDIERLAAHDCMGRGESDWRVTFDAPLSNRTYQRQGRSRWYLIENGMGFA